MNDIKHCQWSYHERLESQPPRIASNIPPASRGRKARNGLQPLLFSPDTTPASYSSAVDPCHLQLEDTKKTLSNISHFFLTHTTTPTHFRFHGTTLNWRENPAPNPFYGGCSRPKFFHTRNRKPPHPRSNWIPAAKDSFPGVILAPPISLTLRHALGKTNQSPSRTALL